MRGFLTVFLCILLTYPLMAQYPGQIDNTFGDLGRTVFQAPDGFTTLKGIKKSSDGMIYICGEMSGSQSGGYIARFTYDGEPDNTFNNGTNFVVFRFGGTENTQLSDLAVLSDGKILVVGSVFVSSQESHPAAARFLPNGTPDPSFGYGGNIIYNQVNGQAYALTLLYTNHYVIACTFNSSSDYNLGLIGCLPGGALNTSFGDSGLKEVDLNNGSYDLPGSISFYNSRIIVSSVAHQSSYDAVVLTAFSQNGQLDNTFGSGGIAVFDGLTIFSSPILSPATRHTLDANGRIWVASHFQGILGSSGMLLRFLSNGTPDVEFGDLGMRLYDFGTDSQAWFFDIGTELDNKVIIAGKWYSIGFSKTLFARFLDNGDLDPTVGSNNSGYVLHSMATGGLLGDYASRLLFPWYDKVIFGGWCDTENNPSVYLARIYLGITVGLGDRHEISHTRLNIEGNRIELSIPEQDKIEWIGLYELNGKLLKSISKSVEKSANGTTLFTLEEKLNKGIYLLNVVTTAGSRSYKLVVP
ncbi:MAG: hypothetical protein PWR20_915 [Bacteroidales bacterium]|jgi:uncharacterized delta-60 repeat protein|nr:hypothetical protein [Bacteroidales bacterium]MDN5329888.1 hypothetical protein [Bacteroidales bacterium]